MIEISTKTRSIREKLAITIVIQLGADITYVVSPSTPEVLRYPYATVLPAVNTVTTTRPSKISCLGGLRTVTPGLAGLEEKDSNSPDRGRSTRRRSTIFHGDGEGQARMGGIIKNLKYLRHLTMINDLCIPFMENILVVDNGCDQTIVNINCFLIQSFASIQSSVGEALNSMTTSTLKLVNESYTLVTLPNKSKVIFK